MLDIRKEKILQLVVENYTETAEPVGSKFLVEECNLDVSGATVRNEMRDLEEQGFLTHPHTSSGRMPTEQGFGYYIEHIMKPKELGKKTQEDISRFDNTNQMQYLKQTGKYIAADVHNAVIIAFGEDSLYYTGLSDLFSQPEFHDYAFTVQMSTIFDHVEERISYVFDLFTNSQPHVVIGEKNPFGGMCGLVGGRLGDKSLFAVLGPMRMDYARNYSFVNYLQRILNV